MSSSSAAAAAPGKDPHAVLGVPLDATEAEIRRAYRRRALELHPDKQPQQPQSQSQSQSQTQRVGVGVSNKDGGEDRGFHDLQAARDFLLLPEHREARENYLRKRRSQRAREETERARRGRLSEGRKRMRSDLERREEEARSGEAGRKGHRQGQQGKGRGVDVEDLRREGGRLREEYASRRERHDAEEEEEARRQAADRKRKEKADLEDRQVRLKWSRKKLEGAEWTEGSLAAALSEECGEVEKVEMLGSKGGSALVTFAEPGSCSRCVLRYSASESMRAHYVGERKRRERERRGDDNGGGEDDGARAGLRRGRDEETLEQRELRRAAERDAIMRQMNDEEGEQEDGAEGGGGQGASPDSRSSGPYPPPLPAGEVDERYAGLETPLQRLERAEEILLKGIASDQFIQGLKRAAAGGR
jgi:DnaJ family protein C protein 17